MWSTILGGLGSLQMNNTAPNLTNALNTFHSQKPPMRMLREDLKPDDSVLLTAWKCTKHGLDTMIFRGMTPEDELMALHAKLQELFNLLTPEDQMQMVQCELTDTEDGV